MQPTASVPDQARSDHRPVPVPASSCRQLFRTACVLRHVSLWRVRWSPVSVVLGATLVFPVLSAGAAQPELQQHLTDRRAGETYSALRTSRLGLERFAAAAAMPVWRPPPGERSALRCRAPPCSRGVRVKKGAVPPVGVCAARGPAGRCADRRSAFQAVPALFRNRRYAVSRPSGPRCRSEDRRSLPNSVAEAGLATPGGAPAPTSNPLKRERLRPFPGGPYTRCPHSGRTEFLVHREVTDA